MIFRMSLMMILHSQRQQQKELLTLLNRKGRKTQINTIIENIVRLTCTCIDSAILLNRGQFVGQDLERFVRNAVQAEGLQCCVPPTEALVGK